MIEIFKEFAALLWGIMKEFTTENGAELPLSKLKKVCVLLPENTRQSFMAGLVEASGTQLEYNVTSEAYNRAYKAVMQLVKTFTPEALKATSGASEKQAYENEWKNMMDTLREVSAISPLWLQIALVFTDYAEAIEKELREQLKSVA